MFCNKKCSSSIIPAILITAVLVVSAFLLAKRNFDFVDHKKEQKEEIGQIEDGKSCTAADVEKLTVKGWQCYLYGKASFNRKGIWITPEVHMPNYETFSAETIYKDFLDRWKTFYSPDNIFSFKYPRAWSINTANWKEFQRIEILEEPSDLSSAIFIEMRGNDEGVADSMISIDDEIQQLGSNSSVVEQIPFDLNGSQAVIVRTAPKITTDSEYTHIFIPKGKYFIHAFVLSSSRDTFYEFPRQLLLSSIKVK